MAAFVTTYRNCSLAKLDAVKEEMRLTDLLAQGMHNGFLQQCFSYIGHCDIQLFYLCPLS